MFNLFAKLMNGQGPQYSTAPQFVLSNDTINQSLDMLVIFKVYFESKMDDEAMRWLRNQLNIFLSQTHHGTCASQEVLALALNRKPEDEIDERCNDLKYSVLIGCIVFFMTYGDYTAKLKPSLMKFLNSDVLDLTIAEYNAALRVLYFAMYNQHYDYEFSATPRSVWKDYFEGKFSIYTYREIDFLPDFSVFESQFLDLEKHVLNYRDKGRFIDIDYPKNAGRRMVKSDTEFEACKKVGEVHRQQFFEKLTTQRNQLTAAKITM